MRTLGHRSARLLLWAAALAAGLPGRAAEASDGADSAGGGVMVSNVSADSHREVDTDPCNFVEGPYTLERGRAQMELDLFSFARHHFTADGDRQQTDTVVWSALKFRAALSADCELQVVHDGYVRALARDYTTGDRTAVAGLGDTTLRLKENLCGNDHGHFALAVAAFATLPTGRREISAGQGEQGATLAFAANLAAGASDCLDCGTQLVWHHADTGSFGEAGQSLLYTHTFSEKQSVSVELNVSRTTGPGTAWLGNSSLCWSYTASKRLVLNAGLNVGLSRATDDYAPFVRLIRWF